jgi:hypothetical protein
VAGRRPRLPYSQTTQRSRGRIFEGRNRYRACQTAGVPYAAEVYSGAEPVNYVASLNLKRRHLSETQRSMVAAKIANLQDGQRKSGSSIGEATMQQEAAATY